MTKSVPPDARELRRRQISKLVARRAQDRDVVSDDTKRMLDSRDETNLEIIKGLKVLNQYAECKTAATGIIYLELHSNALMHVEDPAYPGEKALGQINTAFTRIEQRYRGETTAKRKYVPGEKGKEATIFTIPLEEFVGRCRHYDVEVSTPLQLQFDKLSRSPGGRG